MNCHKPFRREGEGGGGRILTIHSRRRFTTGRQRQEERKKRRRKVVLRLFVVDFDSPNSEKHFLFGETRTKRKVEKKIKNIKDTSRNLYLQGEGTGRVIAMMNVSLQLRE